MKGTTSQFLHCATLLPVPVLGGDGAGCADIVMIIHQNEINDKFEKNSNQIISVNYIFYFPSSYA